jgi:malate dehydrogenase (oxaloacetate-decarboxylating)
MTEIANLEGHIGAVDIVRPLENGRFKKMAKDPLVFALANPEPEMLPEEATSHVALIASRHNDYPNQINSILFFLGFSAGL